MPTDGSHTARKAAEYAYDLATLSGATVTLLSVINLGAFIGRPSVPSEETPTKIVQPLEDYLRQAAELDMREIEAKGAQKGIDKNRDQVRPSRRGDHGGGGEVEK